MSLNGRPRIVDLSHPIHEGMTTFPVPWHPPVEITQLGRHGIEGRESRRIVLGSHTGTHVDAPRHFVEGGQTVDQIPLAQLVGPAAVIDLTPVRPRQVFDAGDLAERLGSRRPERLILRFDWSDQWGTLGFYRDSPSLTQDAARFLLDAGVRVVAMDTPQLDHPDHGRGCELDSPIHRLMLGAGAVFVECCTNLRALTGDTVELHALPLNVLAGDGAPCRVAAIER